MNRSIFVRILAVAAMALIPLGTGLAFQPAAATGTLTVSVQGQGSVMGEGIDCTQSGGPDCSEFYASVEECTEIPGRPPICRMVPPTVVLPAGPDSNGYVFDTWTGCDSVDGRECTVTVAGNVNPIARFRDAQSPSVSAVSPSNGFRSGVITLSAAVSDNAGVTKVEFFHGLSKLGEDVSAPYELAWNSTTVSDGPKSFTARAHDAAGNATTSGATAFMVDNTDPAISVTSGPNGQTFGPGSTQSWTFSTTDGSPLTVTCSVVLVSQPASFGPCSGGTAGHSVTNLPEGSYVFQVKASDAAGNITESATHNISIDSTAPDTSITSGPADGSTTSASVTFGLGSTAPSDTFECRVYATGTTAPAFASCSGAASHTASGLAGGSYLFEARATDGHGNTDASPVQRSFAVDVLAPNTSITKAPKDRIRITTRRARVAFGFSSNEAAAHFQCRMDANAWASCTSPKAFRVGKGSHTFKVRAIDDAGNRDATPASRTFRVVRS